MPQFLIHCTKTENQNIASQTQHEHGPKPVFRSLVEPLTYFVATASVRCGILVPPSCLPWVTLPVCPQVNAADAQVVAGPDEARLQLEGSRVGLHRLLAAVAIRQRGAQPIPQKVVLEWVRGKVHRSECAALP